MKKDANIENAQTCCNELQTRLLRLRPRDKRKYIRVRIVVTRDEIEIDAKNSNVIENWKRLQVVVYNNKNKTVR
jgi:hypothetical protein